MKSGIPILKISPIIMVALTCAIVASIAIGFGDSRMLPTPEIKSELIKFLFVVFVRWGGWAGFVLGVFCVLLAPPKLHIAIAFVALVVFKSLVVCIPAACKLPSDFVGSLFLFAVINLSSMLVGWLLTRVFRSS